MAVEKTGDGSIIITGNDIEVTRWLRVRSALGLEIKTGMKRSHRGSTTRQLANQITGQNCGTSRKAYEALDAFIAEKLGPNFTRPLPS